MDATALKNFYSGKKVLITGHTGFKGAWLTHVLLGFGARVVGVGLAPYTPDDIFVRTTLAERVVHHEFDIRDAQKVRALIEKEQPDVVFHLAAQSLVRRSYDEPLLTVDTNVMGTANVLDAVRDVPSVKAVVVVTTDKVYKNQEQGRGYQEDDPLGGYDPYSGSKAAADIVAQSYVHSFFNPASYGDLHTTLVGIARAGNVIGGGDWSPDRLIPDVMRAVLHDERAVTLRYPDAVRPWEHVLEPISGYLMLAQRLYAGEQELSGAWNFGPGESSWMSVGEVVARTLELLGKGTSEVYAGDAKHETSMLVLDAAKARESLGWETRWGTDEALVETAAWYTGVHENPGTAECITQEQIARYFSI
jgi:CDP-glucose 4,6-dehydratase